MSEITELVSVDFAYPTPGPKGRSRLVNNILAKTVDALYLQDDLVVWVHKDVTRYVPLSNVTSMEVD